MNSMKVWQPLTPAQLARAEEWLRNPPPGSKAEAAQRFGTDLTLLLQTIRLTPAERAERMHRLCIEAANVRGIARRNRAGK